MSAPAQSCSMTARGSANKSFSSGSSTRQNQVDFVVEIVTGVAAADGTFTANLLNNFNYYTGMVVLNSLD